MGDLICYRKYFSDIEKEEKWLNEMAEKGLLLKEVRLGFLYGSYCFEKSNAKYTYRLDYSRDGAVMEELTSPYVMFVTGSCEAQYVCYYDGKVYFRKSAERGEFPKLHSDPNSLYEQEKKRFGQYMGISSLLLFDIAYILFEGIFDVMNEHTNWFTVVCIVCMVFAAVWLVFGIRGIIAAKRKMNELKKQMG